MGRRKKSEDLQIYEDMLPLIEECHALRDSFLKYEAEENEKEEKRRAELAAFKAQHKSSIRQRRKI